MNTEGKRNLPPDAPEWRAPTGQLPDRAEPEQPSERRLRFREESMARLQRVGVVEFGPKQEIIVDLDKLRDPAVGARLRGSHWARGNPQEFGGRSTNEIIFHAFHGRDVVSRDDWTEAQASGQTPKPKRLFYEPESPEAAFNIDAIRSQDFYLGPWEMNIHEYDGLQQTTGNGKKVDLRESALACAVYHPQYGRGYRDPQGRLQVWDSRRNSFHPITCEWFQQETGNVFGNARKHGDSIYSPRRFLEQHGRDLIDHRLLVPEDFRALSTGPSFERTRFERPVHHENGYTMVGGVRYYLGRGERFRGARVVQIAPDLAGVVSRDPLSGRDKLTHTFTLLSKTDPRLREAGSTIPRATKKLTDLEAYDPEEHLKRRAGEDGVAYERRRQALADFDYIMKFSARLSTEAGINLSTLDLGSQASIARAARELRKDPERIFGFAKKYGLEGIQSFLPNARWPECAEAMLDLGEKLPPADAGKIFHRYAEIVRASKQIEQYVTDNFRGESGLGEEGLEKIEDNLLERGRKLLVDFSRAGKRDIAPLLANLENASADLLLFASTFQTMREGDRALALEDFRDTAIETLSGKQLTDRDRAEMKRLAAENHRQAPAKEQVLVSRELAQAMADPATKFYIIKRLGKIGGFMRFTPQSDGRLYVGSLNIAPDARGSDFGRALLHQALQHEAREGQVITAFGDPQIPITERYIGEFGFVATGLDEKTLKDGQLYLELQIDAGENQSFKYFNRPLEEWREKCVAAEQADISGDIAFVKLDLDATGLAGQMEKLFKTKDRAITAWRRDPEEKNLVYAVVEKRPPPAEQKLPRAA